MIHIFFCASAAGTFKQLLHSRGQSDKVVALTQELDVGPISHGELADRQEWLNQNAPFDNDTHDWLAHDEARFRNMVLREPDRVIWIAPASATEQAGLYWYLSKFGGIDLKLAIADFPFDGTYGGLAPLKLGELGLEPMGWLFDNCPRQSWDESRFPQTRWNALVDEKSLLRAVIDGALQSVPDAYFDHHILTRCPDRWVNWHRVMADAMGDIWHSGQSVGIDLLLWRFRKLIEEGKVACDGKLPSFGDSVSDAVKIRSAG